MTYKNYFAVSKMKVDTRLDYTKGAAEKDEKSFYKGTLILY